MNTEELIKQRGSVHGDPAYNLAAQGALKAIYREALDDPQNSVNLGLAHNEAMEMVLFKIGRIATCKVIHLDNYDDLIGYATIARDLAMKSMSEA